MAIDKVTGTAWADLSKISNVAKADIAKVAGQDAPAASPSQLSSLIGWWDPSEATSGDTTLSNKITATNDHYQNSINGAAITTLNGLNCWYLDGTNDRVGTANINATGTIFPTVNNNTEFTIEGWIRSNGSWINNGNWWNMGYNSGYRNRFTSSGNLWNYPRTTKQTTGTFSTNTWHHICVTMSSSNGGVSFGTMKVYKNGSLMQDFGNIGTTPNYSGGAVNFWGAYGNTSEFGRFYMGMCRRYTVELTASEVAYNYNLEKADYGY